MSNNNKRGCRLTIDTLTDIAHSIVEHRELADSILTLNFIDHYRAYLQHFADEEMLKVPLVSFSAFIINQNLLNSASDYIALDTAEEVIPPTALKLLAPAVKETTEKAIK